MYGRITLHCGACGRNAVYIARPVMTESTTAPPQRTPVG